MEAMVKKYQQKYRRVRDEMGKWDELQSRFLTQFRNASSIIERLQVIKEPKNYGELTCVNGITDALLGKQMESLETIFSSMNLTLKEFHDIVISLEKISRDGNQLLKGGSLHPTDHQMQLRVGMRPSLAQCLEGLTSIHEMHLSEYLLKSSIISALLESSILGFLQSSSSDLGALHQLLSDQPNIPQKDVKSIFDTIYAEES